MHSGGGLAGSKIRLGIFISVLILLAGFLVGCGLLGETTYILDVIVNKEEAGSVHKEPDLKDYTEGTTVKLTAVPDDGWEFKEWQGDAEGTDPVIQVEMDEDKEIKAIFEKEEYRLAVEVVGDGEVVVEPDQETYNYGDEVTLTAVPDDGWEFKEWSEDASGENKEIEIMIDGDKNISAVFERDDYSLNINIIGEGQVDKEVLSSPESDYTYETILELTAVPDDGWEFKEWQGDAEGTDPVIQVEMDEDKDITAVFEDKEYNVSGRVVDEDGDGIEGVVISFDAGYGTTESDEEGKWSKKGLEGEVEISASMEGYSFAPGVYKITASRENVNFVGIEPEEGQEEIKFEEETKIMTKDDVENVIEVSAGLDTISFAEKTPFIENLRVGDALVAKESLPGAEKGLIKKVTGKSEDGKTIEIAPATLEDVLKEGEISISETMSIEYMMENIQYSEGVRVLDINKQANSHPIKFEPIDGVRIEGELIFTAATEINIDVRYRVRLDEFEFIFKPGFEKSLNLTVEKNVEWDGDYVIGIITVPPIPIWGPITIRPEIRLVAGTEGEISAKLEKRFDYERNYDVGFRYTRGSGWEPINKVGGSGFNIREPILEGSVEALVYAGPELYGFAGVGYAGEAGLGVSVHGNIEAVGLIQILPSWAWEYDLRMFLEAGLEAELHLLRIANLEYSSPSYEFYNHDIAYGVSGQVTDDEGKGIPDVNINFAGTGDFDAVKTNDEGYWSKHLLRGNVKVTASKGGYNFEPSDINIDGSSSVINFVGEKDGPEIEYTLTMGVMGEGTVDPPEGDHDYEKGEIVDIKATPVAGWEFVGWEGNVADEYSAETTVTMDGDKTVAAHFDEKDDDIIEFEDENFEQAVREAIGKPTGDIFLEDVIDLEELDASGRGIENLEGIQYLQSLTQLNVGWYYDFDEGKIFNNYIEDISPLENLTSLESLDFSGNQIEDISVLENLTNLEGLDFQLNQASDIGVLEHLIRLERLFFCGNEVSDISPLENLTSLETLWFHTNQVEDISSLENLTSLEILWFHTNQVEDITPIENLTNLVRLEFWNNEVSDISALVANVGFGSGDYIDMQNNYLDLTPGSQNMEDINTLIGRGVEVEYEPQRDFEGVESEWRYLYQGEQRQLPSFVVGKSSPGVWRAAIVIEPEPSYERISGIAYFDSCVLEEAVVTPKVYGSASSEKPQEKIWEKEKPYVSEHAGWIEFKIPPEEVIEIGKFDYYWIILMFDDPGSDFSNPMGVDSGPNVENGGKIKSPDTEGEWLDLPDLEKGGDFNFLIEYFVHY